MTAVNIRKIRNRGILLWRYEARRTGWTAAAAPITALLLAVALGLVAASNGAPRAQVGRLLLAGLEVLLPLAVAMTAVSMIARDSARELHLALPTRYAHTLGRRLGTLGLAAVAAALLFSGVLALTGLWAGPGGLAAPLVWLAPTLWLGALALLVAVLVRSVVVATTAIGVLWLSQLLFASWFLDRDWVRPFYLFTTVRVGVDGQWWTNRWALTASALLLVALLGLLLRRPHLLLTEEEV